MLATTEIVSSPTALIETHFGGSNLLAILGIPPISFSHHLISSVAVTEPKNY
jgi:hypothetical protein